MQRHQILLTAIISAVVFFILNAMSTSDQKTNTSSALEARILSLETSLSDLRIKQTENSIQLNNLTSNQAYFTPSTKGYAKINTPAGDLIISLVNIEKYANGYRLYFDIGNPTLATFYDVKMIVRMNKDWDFKGSYEDYEKRAKQNEIDLDSNIMPARWNHVMAVVSPASEEDTANIRVELITSKLSLIK